MKNKTEKKEQKSFDQKEYYRLGINIQAIRKAYNETQEQLALSINVSKSAICNYETGQRIPNRDELNAIAKHYNIPASRLMYGDFSKYSIANGVLVTNKDNQEMLMAYLFPIICSEDAICNKHFKQAYELHLEIRESILSDDRGYITIKNIDKCNELYQKAAEEGIYDAYANMLWWPFYLLIGISNLSTSPQEFSEKISIDTTVGDIYSYFMPNFDSVIDKEWENEKKELFEHYKLDIWTSLVNLKNVGDVELCEIADYYIALGYIFNIFRTGLNSSESRMVGHEMMITCCIMKNEYARNFCSLYDTLNENEKQNS